MFGKSSPAARALTQSPTEQKIEVISQPSCEGTEVALRLSTWTDGLGWCVQKTICLRADQLDELQRSLTVARHRARRRAADAGRPVAPAQVIQLPTLA